MIGIRLLTGLTLANLALLLADVVYNVLGGLLGLASGR